MPIEVENIDAFGKGLDAVFEALGSEEGVQAFQDLGDKVADTARGYAPEYDGPPREGPYFDPGHLKSQINAEAGRDLATGAPHVSVGAPFYVGGFHEFGTEHEAAKPFMRPALDEWENSVEGEIAGALGALLP